LSPSPRRALFRLRTRLRRRRLPLWYSPSFRLPLTGLEAVSGMEPRRADYVAWWLRDSGAVPEDAVRTPRKVSWEDLDRVHSLELLESIARPETLARIFGVDPSDVPVDEVLSTVRLACGATLAAAREVLEIGGPALNLLGGFHHAAPAAAGGNCPVNDVAVALAAVRADGFDGQAAVLDLDAHPPDGLAACLAADPRAFIGSISGSDWGPIPGADETVLPEGSGDRAYLAALGALLGRMPRPTLAFVIAGGDVLAGDRFGRLGLTLEGARERDLRVAHALDGVPSVWLPGGGYHRDAWKVLAGTGMALATGTSAGIPPGHDPLSARFSRIARELGSAELAEPEFGAKDLEEALGLGTGQESRLLLGYYTASGLEHGLYRYGVLGFLQRIGYGPFRVEIDRADPGDRARLLGEAKGEEHLLIELVLQRRRVAGSEMLFVHWLTLRNPLARFSPARPPLPGQEVPGLGLARELGELLALIARRLALGGVAFCPAHFHTAYAARHNLSFVDSARQGRFEALVRDLAHLPLLEATLAVDAGRVRLDGATYVWEADEMALWLGSPAPLQADVVAAERERAHFIVTGHAAPPHQQSCWDPTPARRVP
jgi:acetoin utilization deacetylase AcuC-like enzyme